jgi:hypothetical protein
MLAVATIGQDTAMEQQRGSGIPIWAWIIIGVVIAVPCIAAVLIAVAAVLIYLFTGSTGAHLLLPILA